MLAPCRLATAAIVIVVYMMAGVCCAAETSGRTKLAVLDIGLIGDLGDPRLAEEHEARQQRATARLRQALGKSRFYTVVDDTPARPMIERAKSLQHLHACNGCELDIARALGAQRVLVAWVYRVSNLILTLNYEIRDVASGATVEKGAFDFRGDNDAAWLRAVDVMARAIEDHAAAVASAKEEPSVGRYHPSDGAPVRSAAAVPAWTVRRSSSALSSAPISAAYAESHSHSSSTTTPVIAP